MPHYQNGRSQIHFQRLSQEEQVLYRLKGNLYTYLKMIKMY